MESIMGEMSQILGRNLDLDCSETQVLTGEWRGEEMSGDGVWTWSRGPAPQWKQTASE